MSEISFVILGNPKALKRHRTYTKGKDGKPLPFPVEVDPSRDAKTDFLTLAHQYAPEKPFDCPVMLDVKFYFPRPKNHYNKKGIKTNAPIWHTSKRSGDFDNLLKFIADALNGVFWTDDGIICCGSWRKFYDTKPRTEIMIKTLSLE